MFFQEATPNTTGYMIAGYAVAFIVMALYVISIYIRSRNLRQDMSMLNEMEEDTQAEQARKVKKPMESTEV
jgi:Na+-transporting methylmalonyl-CoA/oxaloacetate decarboxylase gamma subunit